jgi:hypothetical protein
MIPAGAAVARNIRSVMENKKAARGASGRGAYKEQLLPLTLAAA